MTASLSARRAWIETTCGDGKNEQSHVALRKESVDRNLRNRLNKNLLGMVALRKESVDRNPIVPTELTTLVSRSPQGERG